MRVEGTLQCGHGFVVTSVVLTVGHELEVANPLHLDMTVQKASHAEIATAHRGEGGGRHVEVAVDATILEGDEQVTVLVLCFGGPHPDIRNLGDVARIDFSPLKL